MIQLLICSLLIVLFYLWRLSKFFERHEVKMAPSLFPLIGNTWNILLGQHFKDIIRNIYYSHPDEKYVGIFNFFRPFVVLKDPEIIKEVAIKNSNHFVNRVTSVEESADLFFGNSLFGLRGQKWRDMRSLMALAFTGPKVRKMFDHILICAAQTSEFFVKQLLLPENKELESIQINTKDVINRYTHDAVTMCILGLKLNSLEDPKNEYFVKGSEFINLSGFKYLKFGFMVNFPKVSKMLGINVVSPKMAHFYQTLVTETMKQRELTNNKSNDLIDLFVESKRGNSMIEQEKDNVDTGFAAVEESSFEKSTVKRDWTDNDFTAQTLAFITTTFETTSSLVNFLIYEISIHPEIQNRLQHEIDENNLNEGGKLTYDALLKMKYLDMVVSEAMRKWPAGIIVDRVCTKPYTLSPPNSKSSKHVQLNVGNGIWIPIYALHHDPQYFPYPDVFDPERFSDENKPKIIPGTYLPFGVGPRNCIGSRLALLLIKTGIYMLLLNFDMISMEKSPNPIKLQTTSFHLKPQKDLTVGLRLRANRPSK